MDMTKAYSSEQFNDAYIFNVLKDVYSILKDRGYNPINQIVGYLISGDPGYITSYKGARTLMIGLDRSKIMEVILKKGIE